MQTKVGSRRLGIRFAGCCRAAVTFAALALILASAAGCSDRESDRILGESEKAIVGSYALDHVRAVGIDGTPPPQFAKLENCSLSIQPDHTFAATNFPSSDLSKVVSYTGMWSLRVMKVWETTGYYLTLNRVGVETGMVEAKFLNPDKSNLQVSFTDGKKGLTFYFFKIQGRAARGLH